MSYIVGTPRAQFFTQGTNVPLASGKVYTYAAGTSDLIASYPTVTDATNHTNANANPIILDSNGSANIVLAAATKMVVKDSNDNTYYTFDNINSTTANIYDASGNPLLIFSSTANAVNYVQINNAAAGASPVVRSNGTDSNIGLTVYAVNAGNLNLDGGTTGRVKIGLSSAGTDISNVASSSITIGNASGTTITIGTTGSSTITIGTSATSVTVGTSATTLSLGTNATTLNLGTGTATTLNVSNSGANTVFSGTLNSVVSPFVPVGAVFYMASTTLPTGFLECNGAAVSRTTYAGLFAVIGTTFGVGDGSTTFNLPQGQRQVLMGRGGTAVNGPANTVGAQGGSESHTLSTSETPAHTHSYTVTQGGSAWGVGAGVGSILLSPTSTTTGSTGGGGAHNNVQPSLVMMMIIKY